MITISKEDFNKELENYIDRRTSAREEKEVEGFMKKLFGRSRKPPKEEKRVSKPKKEVVEEEVFVEEETVFEDDDDFEEEDDFYQRSNRQGFFSSILTIFRGKSGDGMKEEFYEEDVSYEEYDNIDEEQVKDFLRELHPWLESFEPRTMGRFKQSTAFRKYKKLLEELDMIQREE